MALDHTAYIRLSWK